MRTWSLVVWVLLSAEVGLSFCIALRESAGSGWIVAPLARPAFLLWLALTALVHAGRRTGGGYATFAARAGAVLVVASIVGTSFATSASLRLRPGESASVGPYVLTYLSSSVYPAPNQIITQALIEVRRDGRMLGRRGTLRRQQLDLFGNARFAPAIRPGVWSGMVKTVYVRWAADSAAGGASDFIAAQVPLVPWLWAGLWLLGVGGLAALWPTRWRT
jgi:cytochrome c biogenesis factor